MEQSQQPASQPRTVSGSTRTHGSRSSNPDKQISQIEKSVTHLLVATKQLLETLTQWSRGNAQEEEVSDVYVRLGYEFNLACRAFNSIGVETSDLGPVPDLLRTILEDTLSQPASPQALDNYLPRIRDIIINLLQGLKRKQSKLRSRPKQDVTTKPPTAGPARQSSLASTVGSNDTTLTSMMETVPGQLPSMRSDSQRDNISTASPEPQDWNSANTSAVERGSIRRSIRRDNQQTPTSDTTSTVSGTTASNLPVLSIPDANEGDQDTSTTVPFPHPPPPPPKQDALTALQRGGDLERRASRRFSAYQIQKHLGAAPNGVPVIPPAQNSPIPNRGREARESMRAVTSRTSQAPTRGKSTRLQDLSPSRTGSAKNPQRISEEPEARPKLETENLPRIAPPDEYSQQDSPNVKTPEEFHGPKSSGAQSPSPKLAATVNGPFSPLKEHLEFDATTSQDEPAPKTGRSLQSPIIDGTAKSVYSEVIAQGRASATPPPSHTTDPDSSPLQTKELTLFLQYKSRVKKFMLPGGYEELTLARLQLAFIEKFAWNTHNNGVDLPEIYIQDPVSGVRHELEDLSDVKDRSVLVLNFEVLDEVKRHFDDGIGSLRTTLEGVRSLLDGQGTMMQRFSDRQLEASKEMARLSAAPAPRIPWAPTVAGGSTATNLPASEASVAELQTLRRDIAVLRQSYATMASDFTAAMTDIKVKAAHVKEAAAIAATPTYEGNAGRAHVNDGKKTLSTNSENLVNKVDDLSDRVEDLRKDVVTRGVRPRARDLEVLSLEINSTAKELAKVKEFMKREKPVWTKIWEQELNLVCTERDDLTQQEELMADLYGDLEDVQNVFNLVEEAMKQQNLQGSGSLRSNAKTVDIDPTVDPNQAKEGVLDEVRALKPNHEDRLEAIERAEKLRQKDLANRTANEFQREVETFVEEGRLKKTGGVDEVERVRKLKDERAAKENWERVAAREAERERKKAEKAAAAAAAQAQATATTNADGPTQTDAPLQTSETAEHIPSLAEIMGEAHAADDDDSQEAGFEDAPTDTIPHTSPSDEPSGPSMNSESPTVGHSSVSKGFDVDNNASENTHSGTEAVVEGKTEDPAPTTASKKGSWWKPAVF